MSEQISPTAGEYTAGPWHYDGNSEFGYLIYAERREGRAIRRLHIGHSHGGNVAGVADASLMAASPLLLQACEAARDALLAWTLADAAIDQFPDVMHKLVQAIRAARGEV